MSEERSVPNGTAKVDPDGTHIIDFLGVSFWESTDRECRHVDGVFVDPKPSGGGLRFSDIPLLVEWLNDIYRLRVTDGCIDLNSVCHACKRPFDERA